MKSISWRIPGFPVGFNESFNIHYLSKEICLSKKAHDYKRKVKLATPPITIPNGTKISIYVEIHSNRWYTKAGSIRKIDVQNLDKLMLDAIFSKLGFDDSIIWNSHFVKVEDKVEYTLIKLEEYKPSI